MKAELSIKRVACYAHPTWEYETDYKIGSEELLVHGPCPNCMWEANNSENKHLQEQLNKYYSAHHNIRVNSELSGTGTTIHVCLGQHGAHEPCKWREYTLVKGHEAENTL